jgi:hypothetical protein
MQVGTDIRFRLGLVANTDEPTSDGWFEATLAG